VAFPQPPAAKKSGSRYAKWIFAVVGVLLIVIAGGWFLYVNYSKEKAEPTPTPSTGGLSSFATPKPEVTPEHTVAAATDVARGELKVEILNGTGKVGEASFLKSKLEKEGYENLTAANADDQNETRTTVTYGDKVSQAVMDEMTKLLEDIYDKVRVKKSSMDGVDIRIVTGPRKGAEAAATSPAVTATSTPSASPSPTTTASPEAG
jgi:hypothetical protein